MCPFAVRRHLPFVRVACALTALGLLSMGTARAQAPATLVVRLYNTAGVSTDAFLAARRSAEQILRGAGLDVVIRHCGRSSAPADDAYPCDAPLTSSEVVVRLIDAPAATSVSGLPDDAYGMTYVVRDTGRGWLATVFADRVESAAVRAGVERGTLIGRVMAHEVGHLLLGNGYHGTAGVMRAEWPDSVLHRRPSDWWFSMSEADRMHRALSGSVARVGRAPAL